MKADIFYTDLKSFGRFLGIALFPKRVGDCLIEDSENGCHGGLAMATTSGMKMAAIADPYGEHSVRNTSFQCFHAGHGTVFQGGEK